MESKPKVIINCRSKKFLHPALQKSLSSQTCTFDLEIVESPTCPNRLSQIQDENRIYFFFDEDVELPSADYVKSIMQIFETNPNLQVLGGCYLSKDNIPYLAKAYNAQIEFWISSDKNLSDLQLCQNLPGGVWIISGQIKNQLHDWIEPFSWAGEDTYSLRWLQKKGIQTFYHRSANLFHYPRNQFLHFCTRAFLQGQARQQHQLHSQYQSLNWKQLWNYRFYWLGWGLHQFFVELGSFLFIIQSFKLKKIPNTSPVA